jgi:hypothetical protein
MWSSRMHWTDTLLIGALIACVIFIIMWPEDGSE